MDRSERVMQEKIQLLKREVERCYPEWGIGELTPVGAGLECLVCRAESREHGTVALRTPWVRWIENANDGNLDARDILRKEAILAQHLHEHGVKTPSVYMLHEGDVDFMVSAFIEHDGSEPNSRQMGRLTRAIHAAPVIETPMMPAMEQLNAKLAERLVRRTAVAAQLSGVDFRLPSEQDVLCLLGSANVQGSILHMDIRPANLLTRAGEIGAIVDWSNALIGDAGLELVRIAEYGHVDHEFLAGYGTENGFAHLPKVVELLYRLDTATMLANVFLSEAPNPELARGHIRRLIELHERLEREL